MVSRDMLSFALPEFFFVVLFALFVMSDAHCSRRAHGNDAISLNIEADTL
jgi:acid phosphatase family membrane protein YuiD